MDADRTAYRPGPGREPQRPNLTVLTRTRVRKIAIENGRATADLIKG